MNMLENMQRSVAESLRNGAEEGRVIAAQVLNGLADIRDAVRNLDTVTEYARVPWSIPVLDSSGNGLTLVKDLAPPGYITFITRVAVQCPGGTASQLAIYDGGEQVAGNLLHTEVDVDLVAERHAGDVGNRIPVRSQSGNVLIVVLAAAAGGVAHGNLVVERIKI